MEGKDKWVRIMKTDWNDRARHDAFHYTAWRRGHKWDEASFFEPGERDYVLLVEPILQSMGLEPGGSVMLEMGCGVGRMTGSFARRFGHVFAIDVSSEMLTRAQGFHRDLTNVTWQEVNGLDMEPFQSGQIDFAFSFLVFQHVPHRDIILASIGEMLRVLKPDGSLLFQYNGDSGGMDWMGRLIWDVLDRWRIPFVARIFNVDSREAGKTWAGATLGPSEVSEYIDSHGGAVVGTRGDGTPGA